MGHVRALAVVLLSASVLGTGTISFAMEAEEEDDFTSPIVSSSSKTTLPLTPTDQDKLQADIAIFKGHLYKVVASLSIHVPYIPSIFFSYSWSDDAHIKRVEALALDLKDSGVPLGKILLDRWASRPGSGTDIFNHADLILNADKVILIGSPELKEKYENRQGIVSQELTNLRTRLEDPNKKTGIIPAWFEGNFADNFPSSFQALPAHSLAGDYFTSFFNLLINIYQLNPINNFILNEKREFERLRKASPATIIDYGQKLLVLKKKQAEEDERKARIMLERSLAQQTPLLRNWVAVASEILTFQLPDRNTCFFESKPLGKEDSYLTAVWKKLNENQHALISGSSFKRFTVSGLGGVGKTQLALAYVWEAFDKKAYNTIYWFQLSREASDQENKASLKEQYKEALEDLGVKDLDVSMQERAIKSLLERKLNEKSQKRLLVYDDVTSRESIQGLIPQVGCHILYTSRDSLGWEEREKIDLDVFQPKESVQFLLDKSGIEDTEENRNEAIKVAEALGNLPLALEQAAGYIRAEQISFSVYLKEFSKRAQNLLSSGADNTTYAHVVATTWAVTMRRVSNLAQQLMGCFAYLGSDDIPLTLFFSSELGTEKTIRDATNELTRYSMIKRKEGNINIHQLVQLIKRLDQERYQEDTKESDIKHFLNKLVKISIEEAEKRWKQTFTFYNTEKSTLERLAKLVPHSLSLANHCYRLGVQTFDLIDLSVRLGSFLNRQHRFADAEEVLLKAQSLAEIRNDSNNIRNWINRNLINTFLGSENIPKIRTIPLKGLDHLTKGVILCRLGKFEKAKVEKAEALYKLDLKASEIDACKFGRNCLTRLALIYKDLGEFYAKQGDHSVLALEYLKDALSIYSPKKGKEPNDDTASTLVWIGRVLCDMNDYVQAQAYFDQGLRLFGKLYPAGNREAAVGLRYYAEALYKGGKKPEALRTLQKASEMADRFYSQEEVLMQDINTLFSSYSESEEAECSALAETSNNINKDKASEFIVANTDRETIQFKLDNQSHGSEQSPGKSNILDVLPIPFSELMQQLLNSVETSDEIRQMVGSEIYHSFFKREPVIEMGKDSNYAILHNQNRKIRINLYEETSKVNNLMSTNPEDPELTTEELLESDPEEKDTRLTQLRVLKKNSEEMEEKLWEESTKVETCKTYLEKYFREKKWTGYIPHQDRASRSKISRNNTVLDAVAQLNNLKLNVWVKPKRVDELTLNYSYTPKNNLSMLFEDQPRVIDVYHTDGLTSFYKLIRLPSEQASQ